MAILTKQQGNRTIIKEFLNRTRQVKTIYVDIFFVKKTESRSFAYR